MVGWYLQVWRNAFNFKDRARRAEYWWFTLANIIAFIVLAIIDVALGTFDAETGTGVFSLIYTLAVLIPSLSVTVRRLHDRSRTGWWLLIWLIPLIGALVILVFLIQEGDAGDNEYGADPKQDMQAA